jgi:HEAT repeat protein
VPLLTAASRDDSPKIRSAAVQSLGLLNVVTAVPELMRAMNDSDAWVRYYAARALGQIRSPESIDALGAALRQDKATQVRIAAADALGGREPAEHVIARADGEDAVALDCDRRVSSRRSSDLSIRFGASCARRILHEDWTQCARSPCAGILK